MMDIKIISLTNISTFNIIFYSTYYFYCNLELCITFIKINMDEMVVTEVTKNQQEKLNLEIFKQIAREQGIDVSKVGGTGARRECVPDFMKEDICERPKRKSRPNSWEDTGYNDESSFN